LKMLKWGFEIGKFKNL